MRNDRTVIGLAARTCEQVALERMTPDAASALGPALAAIEPWMSYPISGDALAAYLARTEPGAPRLALTLEGQAIGAVGLRLNWLRGPYLQLLGVLPRAQGLGLGQRVLEWIEREAMTAGDRNIWVAAADYNHGAIRFYERNGFQHAAAFDGLVWDNRSDVLMRKRLSPVSV